ncbi:MAG: endonuclease domain-containing protein [Ruminococcus sp.]
MERYIVDFYCSAARLVIELDGSQHYTEDGEEYDEIRTEILEQYQLEVLRFSNGEVDRNFEGVCRTIEENVKLRLSE